MMHVDEGALLAYLDEEASETEHRRVAEHLAVCASCAGELRRLGEISGDLPGVLATLDVPAPVARARARFDSARRAAAVQQPRPAVAQVPAARSKQPRRFRIGLLQAATLALVLAGVAGAAIPGSPLRVWVESVIEAAFAGEEAPAPAQPVAPAIQPEPVEEPPAPPLPSGDSELGVAPADGRVQVVLDSPPAGTRVRVELSDAPDATVRAVASLRAAAGRLTAFAIAPGEIVVMLPRGAAVATIEVDDHVLLRSEAGVFVQLPAGVTPSGDEVILRVGR